MTPTELDTGDLAFSVGWTEAPGDDVGNIDTPDPYTARQCLSIASRQHMQTAYALQAARDAHDAAPTDVTADALAYAIATELRARVGVQSAQTALTAEGVLARLRAVVGALA